MSREDLLRKAAEARAASERIFAEKQREKEKMMKELKMKSERSSEKILSDFERKLNEYANKYS